MAHLVLSLPLSSADGSDPWTTALLTHACRRARNLHIVLEHSLAPDALAAALHRPLLHCYARAFAASAGVDCVAAPQHVSTPLEGDARVRTAGMQVMLSRPGLISDALLLKLNAARRCGGHDPLVLETVADAVLAPLVESDAGVHDEASSSDGCERVHDCVCLGGTFDHLHAGHKLLLTIAGALTSQRLIVGLTTDAMLERKRFVEAMQPYTVREGALRAFMAAVWPGVVLEVTPLSDPFGPAGTRADLQCMVVSPESRRVRLVPWGG